MSKELKLEFTQEADDEADVQKLKEYFMPLLT